MVRKEGEQLQVITENIERNRIRTRIDFRMLTLKTVKGTYKLIAEGRPAGKVILQFRKEEQPNEIL